MTARHFTQTYCTQEKLSKTLPMFSKSLWIKICFSEIITTVILKQNRTQNCNWPNGNSLFCFTANTNVRYMLHKHKCTLHATHSFHVPCMAWTLHSGQLATVRNGGRTSPLLQKGQQHNQTNLRAVYVWKQSRHKVKPRLNIFFPKVKKPNKTPSQKFHSILSSLYMTRNYEWQLKERLESTDLTFISSQWPSVHSTWFFRWMMQRRVGREHNSCISIPPVLTLFVQGWSVAEPRADKFLKEDIKLFKWV